MNMFKKNRKAKEQDDTLAGPSSSDTVPPPKTSRGLTMRKKKKQVVDEEPVFNLSDALPNTNEFRTSLLMPNLSARFSMLREQDDPTSKLGKASDDSVLYPKRASRLMLFNHNPLTDIAEVESIRSGFRPPFADEHHHSISDGYASDDGGSIMNRSRPGEGNNLFGGRQKLYKVTTGPARDSPGSSMTSGKHMYENDVSMSAFQQIRLREKEQREQHRDLDDRTDRSSYGNTESEEHDSMRSPPNAFSKNRGTQSSTNSGPRRTSTAATSVISESPLPPQGNNVAVSKVKEQDANSSAESIGFATSPNFRTVIREDGKPTFRLSGSRSALNMRENYIRQSPMPPSQPFRGMSPPVSATSQPLDFGLGDTKKSSSTTSRIHNASPTAQFDFENDPTLASNVRPNDRGKATAMGLFNKPSRHYDDAQFQQRQVQMHEGRNSPMSTDLRAASRASPEPVPSSRQSYASTNGGIPQEENYPQIPPIPDYPPSPVSNRRASSSSAGRRSISRPRSKASTTTKDAAVKARVESLIRKQNAELAALEATELGPMRSQENVSLQSKDHSSGTFFDTSDRSDDDEEQQQQPQGQSPIPECLPTNMPQPPPPSCVHPALRSSTHDVEPATNDRISSYTRDSDCPSTSRARNSAKGDRQSDNDSVTSAQDIDSPTLPAAGLGLSGLIRTHLRNDSDKSSMLLPPSPALAGTDFIRGSVSSTSRTVTSVKSDPFEYDSQRLSARQPIEPLQAPPTPTTIMSQNAAQVLAAAKALRDAQINATMETPKVGNSNVADNSQDDQLRSYIDSPSHQRSDSTETQREMQRFDDDLAERRKRIQETLTSVQERSRSRSPIAERNFANGVHGFLPRFPGRSNTGDRPEPQSKAMKMLGISPGPKDAVPSPRMPQDQYPSDHDRSRNVNSRQGHRPSPPRDNERPSGRYTPNPGRPPPRSGSSQDRPPPPRSTTPSSRSDVRSRSNSAAADRSVSRNKHIPEFDRSMMPGAFPASPFMNASPDELYGRSDSPANRSYERSGSSAAGRYTDRPGYFGTRSFASPDMNNSFAPRPSPRPSPNSGADFFHTQLGTPTSPSSSAMPSPNPIANGRTTPSNLPGRVTPSGHRKRSVTKYMISDPTFVSSTSTIPLVHLPRDGGPNVDPIIAPPVPAMNPRRRGTGGEQSPAGFSSHPAARPGLAAMPESSMASDFSDSRQFAAQSPPPRQRHKLRKASSEGGNMAARARQQALVAEMAVEKDRSPNVAVFPNRSATSLGAHEGGMF